MSDTPRIRWQEGPAGILGGYAGTLEAYLFSIWQPPQDPGEYVLTSELPGAEAVRVYGESAEELKPEAEKLLSQFIASLGALSPDDTRAVTAAADKE